MPDLLHRLLINGRSLKLDPSVTIQAAMMCLFRTCGNRWPEVSVRLFGPGNYLKLRANLLREALETFEMRPEEAEAHRVTHAEALSITINSLRLHYFNQEIVKLEPMIWGREKDKETTQDGAPFTTALVVYWKGEPYVFHEPEEPPVAFRASTGNRWRMTGLIVATRMLLGIFPPGKIKGLLSSVRLKDLSSGCAKGSLEWNAKTVAKLFPTNLPDERSFLGWESLYHKNPQRIDLAMRVVSQVLGYVGGTRRPEIPLSLEMVPPKTRKKRSIRWA